MIVMLFPIAWAIAVSIALIPNARWSDTTPRSARVDGDVSWARYHRIGGRYDSANLVPGHCLDEGFARRVFTFGVPRYENYVRTCDSARAGYDNVVSVRLGVYGLPFGCLSYAIVVRENGAQAFGAVWPHGRSDDSLWEDERDRVIPVRIGIVPLLLNVFVYIVIIQSVLGVWRIVEARKRQRRRRRGRCPGCLYDLTDLATSERCPECGERADT